MFILIIVLFFLIYKNKKSMEIIELKDQTQDATFENIIDAVNYNDKLLFENQKYIHQVYEENNSFAKIKKNNVSGKNEAENDKQYFNMMKNYDALTHLSK